MGDAAALQLLLLIGDYIADHLSRDWTAIAEFGSVSHPLPDLGAADFGGGGIFHQVVNGNAAGAAQP